MQKLPLKKGIISYEEEALIINQLIDAVSWLSPLNPEFGKVEPTDKLDGKFAYADGVNWMPNGNGSKGFWRWDANSNQWVLVG